MTGIERLREFAEGISPFPIVCGVTMLSYDRKHMEESGDRLCDFLSDIADQIEREQGGRVSRMRVLSVVTEMERHVSGVEGADDSPVARWARELRDALKSDTSVKRPAPKVPDAEGVEICEGDTVWTTYGLGPFEVTRIVYADQLRVIADGEENGQLNAAPKNLTHRAPVLAADGKPLRDGETVWRVKDGDGPYHVTVIRDGVSVCVDESVGEYRPDELTHERPEIDSWERLEEDATVSPEAYCAKRGIDFSDVDGQHRVLDEVTERMARDLVRRARALAERGE